MRTIIASIVPKLPVLPWTPTSFVLNDQTPAPKQPQLPVTVVPIDPMVKGRPGVLQNHWRLVMNADALYLDKYDDHLYACARRYDLVVYAPLYDPAKDEELFARLAGHSTRDDADEPVEKPRKRRKAEPNLFADDGVDLFGSEEPDLFGGDETDLFGSDEPNLFDGDEPNLFS